MLFVASVFVYLFSFYQQEGLWWGRVNKKKKKTNKPTLEEKAANKDKTKPRISLQTRPLPLCPQFTPLWSSTCTWKEKVKRKWIEQTRLVYCRYKSLVAVFLFFCFLPMAHRRAHTHKHTRIHWLAITHWRKRKESDNKQSRLCSRGVRETRQSQSSSSSSSSPSTKVDDVLFRYAIN